MNRTLGQGRVESGIASLARLPRRPIVAGALSGVVAGIALGAFTGPIGVVLGMWMGIGVGLVSGYVLAREDETQSARTQELDTIIGITKGSMGAGLVSIVPAAAGSDADADDPPPYSSKEAWLSEWLTPPPPMVGRTS
jgi:hypothetical protein